MKKLRIAGVMAAFCLLQGGCGAEQETTDAFQAKAADTVQIAKDSSGLTKMPEEQSAALKGYAVFLTEYEPRQGRNRQEETPAFTLIYLDGDDVPELVVIDGIEHADGVSVFKYEEGKIVSVGTYGQYGGFSYQEKEGIVFDDYDQGGNIYARVYQIEGSKQILLQSFSETCYDILIEEDYTYTVDGEEVSKEQYLKVFRKWYETDYKYVDYGMCRLLTAGDIQDGLREELEKMILMREEVPE